MRIQFGKTAALIVCLCLLYMQSASAQRQQQYGNAYNTFETEEASYDNYDGGGYVECSSGNCGCDTCDSGGCCGCDSGGSCRFSSGGTGLAGLLKRPGQFFVAAQYMQVRASFSEATAFVTQTQTAAPASLNNVFNQLEYDHEPSYRVFGGYRFCDCGGEIQFGYTRYDSSANALGVPNAGDVIVAVPEEVFTNTPGVNIGVNSSVTAQSYDLAFSKTIPLGGCCVCGCDCGDACGGSGCDSSGCGCGDNCSDVCCPAWDITWSGGLRFSEVNWDRNAATLVTPTFVGNTSSTVMDFEGGGPRWGLEGRRYLGDKFRTALFLRGDISLLLGDVGITNTRVTAGIPNRTTLNTTQIVPVLDIVAGGTAYIGKRLKISGGYLFSAWHDLGMRDTFDILDDPGFQQPTDLTFDDANILGFDGYFARVEFAF